MVKKGRARCSKDGGLLEKQISFRLSLKEYEALRDYYNTIVLDNENGSQEPVRDGEMSREILLDLLRDNHYEV